MTSTTLERLDDTGRRIVFTGARTANTFSDQPVTDAELADIYELVKWTPTAANVQPLRILFVRTPEGWRIAHTGYQRTFEITYDLKDLPGTKVNGPGEHTHV